MADFLDAYGVVDEKRERRTRRIVIGALAVVLVSTILYFTFRTWSQERVIKRFITLLDQKDYQDAYKMWGCTPATPCKYYPPEKFAEDWGPSGIYSKIEPSQIVNVDYCDSGVVFDITFPKTEQIGLWVERETNIISFAPWPRCPGPHLQLKQFLKSHFGGGTPST